MRVLKSALVLMLAAFAMTAMVAAPANADTLRFSETGEPIASGQLDEGEEHGAIHCQAISEFLGDSSNGTAPGVIVITPANGWQLGAPREGVCEVYYEFFAG